MSCFHQHTSETRTTNKDCDRSVILAPTRPKQQHSNLSIQLLPMPFCYSNNKPTVYRGDRAHFQPRTYTQWCKNRKQRAASTWTQLKVGKGGKSPPLSSLLNLIVSASTTKRQSESFSVLITGHLRSAALALRKGDRQKPGLSGLKLGTNISSRTGTQTHGRRRTA